MDSKYHLELNLECKLSEGWSEIDRLAKEGLTCYQMIGGEGVTTHGLNVMHSGHIGPPGIIFLTYLSFHSTLTPVLLVRPSPPIL